MEFLNKEQIAKFKGTGENNSIGQSLDEFLLAYNPNKYQNPSSTVDILVFSYKEEAGHKKINRVLLIKRGNHPCIGDWATPGGFVEFGENLDAAATRELQEETGIDRIEIEQLKSYGDYDRDPRTRIITTAYVALVPEGSIQAEAADDAKDAAWFCIEDSIVSNQDDHEEAKEKHKLTLYSEEKNVELHAEVEVEWHSNRVLQNRKYTVVNAELLAADHGAIILEAYHYVNKMICANEAQ